MTSERDHAIAAAVARGRRQYARLSEDALSSFTSRPTATQPPPAHRLWEALTPFPGEVRRQRFEAWLAAVVEAVGQGLVGVEDAGSPRGLLARLLHQSIPREPTSPARIAELWNIAEGLRSSVAWMDAIVSRTLDELSSLDDLEAHVAQQIRALCDPSARPLDRLHPMILDCRSHRDDFLPGRLRLITPRVAAVADRLTGAELALAVFPHRTIFAGPVELPASAETLLLETSFEGYCVRLGERRVAWMPMLHAPHASLASPAGFVLATCYDSQRVWLAQ